MKMLKTRPAFRSRQRGFAALLAILLAGLGLTAATLGSLYSVRGVQDANLALHQTTQSQARAWQALEVVRIALQSMPAATLAALPVASSVSSGGDDDDEHHDNDDNDDEHSTQGMLVITGLNGVTARVTSNAPSGSGQRLTVQVSATAANGTASSTIEGVYQVTPGVAGGTGVTSTISNLNGANIKGGLSTGGNFTFLGDKATHNANFNVIGNVDLKGSITGFEKLCASGNISVSSAISINTVCANGTLTLSGSASVVTTATVKGDVSFSGAASITNIVSNGAVSITGGSAHSDSIRTWGLVTIGGNGYAKSIDTQGAVNWTSTDNTPTVINANGTVTYAANSASSVINAIGDVTLTGNGNVKNVSSNGNFILNSNWGNGVQGALKASGSLSGTATGQWSGGVVKGGTVGGAIPNPKAANVVVTKQAGFNAGVATVSVPVVNNAFENTPKVDAYALESSANYAFKIEAATGKQTVTVRGISNITDGTYYFGRYNTIWWPVVITGGDGFLCTAVDNSGICTAPSTPGKTLCGTDDASVNCFSYTAASKTWSLSRTTMAPGVAWFEGSLEVSNGTYFNTFIATGDISTKGNSTSYAVNYAGYAGVCANQTSNGRASVARFAGMYPLDYCNTSTSSMTYQALGNAVFIAGGYKNGAFQGGNISLGSSNEVFGSVIAGNQLQTGGSTTVHGQVYTAAQGTTTTNDFKGSLTIDVSHLPANTTFKDNEIKCMGDCATTGGGTGTPASARVYWSRYL